MRVALVIIGIIFCMPAFSQTGKLDVKITLTGADTSYPYFLNTRVKNEDSTIVRVVITSGGLYHFGKIKQGIYQIELTDYKTKNITIDSVQVLADSVTTISIDYPGICKFVYPANYKPVCPKGHSDGIIKIVYGLPSKSTMKKAKKGLIYLGGCNIADCNPLYYCSRHKLEL